MGDFKQRRLAAAPRVLHPSEDLSELPPLRSVVAGQVYHYRLAGSSQNSLPRLLPAGWVRSSPYWAVFMQVPAQVVFAHPPNRFPSSGSAN